MDYPDPNRPQAGADLACATPRRRKDTIATPIMLSVFAENAVPITIVSAPAGFGKTIALTELFHQAEAAQKTPVWLDGSNEQCSSLAAQPGDIASQVWVRGGPLFIDGADELNPRILAAIIGAAIADEQKLFIAARRIDTLRLARHLAGGDAQILPAELFLWHRGVLAGWKEATLSASQVSSIHRLAEGWPAPTVLLARYLAQGGKAGDVGSMLVGSMVSSYIDDEILAPLAQDWRACIVALSLADTFTDELIDRLAPEGGITLEALKAAFGPLIVAAPEVSHWRFNRLLRQHLHLEFGRLKSTPRSVTRGVVTSWAADRGDIVAAATMMAQDGDEQQFLDLVADAGGATLWLISGHHCIRQLVKIADDAGIGGDARFQLLRCASFLKEGRVAEARALYDSAIPILPDTEFAKRDAAFLQIILAIYCCRDPAPEDLSAFQFLESFAMDEGWSTGLPTIRAIHHLQHAEFDLAMGAIVDAENHCTAAGANYNLLFLDLHRAAIFLAQGDLPAARKALLQSQARWRRDYRHDHGAETVIAALFAQLEFESGRRRNAAAYLKRSGARVLQSEAWLSVYVAALEPMFRLAAEKDGVAATVVAIDRIRDQLSKGGLDRVANLLANLRTALEGEEWLRGQGAAPPDFSPAPSSQPVSEFATWHEREFTMLAGAYRDLAAGSIADAIQSLTEFIDYAQMRNLASSLQRALLLRAAAFDRAGDAIEAGADFERALAIGEAKGLRHAFAEFGGRHTAAQLTARRGATEFVRGLGRAEARSSAATDLSLTGRERQILAALGQGKSDKLIGRDLDITEYGVRFHLRNLYVKLGVHDRVAAVAKATLLI